MDPNNRNLNYLGGMPNSNLSPMSYIDKAIGETKGYYDPYTQNAANPEDVINRIASTFKASPYMDRGYQNRLNAMEANAAASGRINSPGFAQEVGDLASSFYSDEMRKYIQDVMGQQQLGLGAAQAAAGDIGNLYNEAGGLSYNKDIEDKQKWNDLLKSLIQGTATVGGALLDPGSTGKSALSKLFGKLFGSDDGTMLASGDSYHAYNANNYPINYPQWMNY